MPRRPAPDIGHMPAVEDRRVRDRIVIAVYYLAAFVLLGLLVSWHAPSPIDLAGKPFAGQGTKIALLISSAGLFPVYATISVALLILGAVKRRFLRPVLISVATLIVAWQVSDACKALFHRPRPGYWSGVHESSWSYPSGHTTLVIAFYGFWTAVAWMSDLPLVAKRWIRSLFAVLALAIGWARLALGAHYITDLIGGYLLGAAMASFAMIVYRMLRPDEDDVARASAAP